MALQLWVEAGLGKTAVDVLLVSMGFIGSLRITLPEHKPTTTGPTTGCSTSLLSPMAGVDACARFTSTAGVVSSGSDIEVDSDQSGVFTGDGVRDLEGV